MKSRKSIAIGSVFVLVVIGLTVWIVFRNQDLSSVLQILSRLDVRWLFAAFGCWFGCVFAEAVWLACYMRNRGYAVSFPYIFFVSVMGSFYCAITPGASGGQPMQIYYLNKRGVPAGVSTSALSIRFVQSHSLITLVTLFLWFAKGTLIREQLSGVQWLIVMGWIVHLGGIVLVLLAAFWKSAVRKAAGGLVNAGVKLRVVRNQSAASEKLYGWIDGYHKNIRAAGQQPKQMILLTLLNFVSQFLTMATAVCVYRMFGLNDATGSDLLSIAYLLHLSASYNPLPGASGAQEGGFLAFFASVFPPDKIGLAMLVWRFFTYYLHLFAGAGVMLISVIGRICSRGRGSAPAINQK